MQVPSLPDFEHSLALSQGNLDEVSLAECHGVACGLLVRKPDAVADDYFSLLAMLEIINEPGPAMHQVLEEVHQASGAQLADAQMQLVIWLPDDEVDLEIRTMALGHWCNGFLASIGSGGDQRLDTLSPEAGEALADLQEIAMAEVSAEAMAGEASDEEEELAFTEIVEYIRIAVLMLREDMCGPGNDKSIH